jgi:hypothetical protein
MKRILCLLTAFIMFGVVQCSKKGMDSSGSGSVASVEDLLVKDNEISGWGRSGTMQTATNETDLEKIIDGDAPKYVQHGFVEAAEQYYQGSIIGSPTIICLRVFDQGDTTNTAQLMTDLLTSVTSLEEWSSPNLSTAKIKRFPTVTQIYARKSRYYINVSIESNLNEALEILKMFAGNVGNKID